jgi:hypothetical protein
MMNCPKCGSTNISLFKSQYDTLYELCEGCMYEYPLRWEKLKWEVDDDNHDGAGQSAN